MKRISALFMFVMMLTVTVVAQSTIRGTVLDQADDSPISGASVTLEGAKRGITTDANGQFAIQAKMGQVINVSFVGMKPAKVTIDSNNLTIKLATDANVLDEVVAVGYGVTRKRDLAGSVSSIKPEDINSGVVVNTAELIKGRAAGVHVRQTSMEPGGLITVRVRGASSISSNNDPLYVVDGLQTSGGLDLNPTTLNRLKF